MTSIRTRAIVVAIGLTMLLSACDGASRFPALPAPLVGPTIPPAGGTLSGVVFELIPGGRAPIASAEVYCESCGPDGHSLTRTDSDGGYIIKGAVGGVNLLLVAKPGYDLPRPDWTFPNRTSLSWIGGVNATVNGDTRFDIELVRQ
jgi:hypothetical protein